MLGGLSFSLHSKTNVCFLSMISGAACSVTSLAIHGLLVQMGDFSQFSAIYLLFGCPKTLLYDFLFFL